MPAPLERCAEHLGGAAGACLEVVGGAGSLLRGLARGPSALLAAAVSRDASAAGLWRCLLYTPAAVASVLIPEEEKSPGHAHRALEVSQETFFVTLKACDKSAYEHVKGMKVVRSLRQRALSLFGWGVGVTILLGLLVVAGFAVAPMAAPAVTAGATAVLALSPHLLLWLLAGCLPVAALAGGSAYVYTLFEPVITIWRFDPLVALAVLATVAGSSLRMVEVGWALRTGTAYYYSSVMLTQEFLAPYSQRLETGQWRSFCRRHAWRVAGFGLPVTLLVQKQPLAAVALLQIVHAASAVLLADMLGADGHTHPERGALLARASDARAAAALCRVALECQQLARGGGHAGECAAPAGQPAVGPVGAAPDRPGSGEDQDLVRNAVLAVDEKVLPAIVYVRQELNDVLLRLLKGNERQLGPGRELKALYCSLLTAWHSEAGLQQALSAVHDHVIAVAAAA
ncbi:unnamed protein product [Prorocentrum cordatum]|uniref:Nucleoporin NDC1 n=1 Tax=Prorocentrum cordatum TaxID=2364126 RepID=A0ABN9T435_9DINO|nr:unnamed protein product [Polarella glacialis]